MASNFNGYNPCGIRLRAHSRPRPSAKQRRAARDAEERAREAALRAEQREAAETRERLRRSHPAAKPEKPGFLTRMKNLVRKVMGR